MRKEKEKKEEIEETGRRETTLPRGGDSKGKIVGTNRDPRENVERRRGTLRHRTIAHVSHTRPRRHYRICVRARTHARTRARRMHDGQIKRDDCERVRFFLLLNNEFFQRIVMNRVLASRNK